MRAIPSPGIGRVQAGRRSRPLTSCPPPAPPRPAAAVVSAARRASPPSCSARWI